MRGLDDTDRKILRLLSDDARRPYSDIAETVGLSAPAVSDRVDRLQEIGLIRNFTLDIDRTLLDEGIPVLVTVETAAGAALDVRNRLARSDAIEHVFRTVDDRVVCTATVPDGAVDDLLADVVGLTDVRTYEVRLLADTDWSPRFDGSELAPACAECGNTVTTEGEAATLDGDIYHFCCENCRAQFVENYDALKENI